MAKMPPYLLPAAASPTDVQAGQPAKMIHKRPTFTKRSARTRQHIIVHILACWCAPDARALRQLQVRQLNQHCHSNGGTYSCPPAGARLPRSCTCAKHDSAVLRGQHPASLFKTLPAADAGDGLLAVQAVGGLQYKSSVCTCNGSQSGSA